MRNLSVLFVLWCAALPGLAADPASTSGDTEVIVPREMIRLFSGRDLSSFYTWLVDSHREDPHRVFSVVDQVDGAPAIRISGQIFGGLTTKQRFANYRLVAEFR